MIKLTLSSVFLCLALTCGAQTNSELSSLSHESEHYKLLSSKSPLGKENELDKMEFPAADWNFMKNYLLLRTNYLDVSPEYFNLKPFPANSSDQTKAELDYLLELQTNRTKEQENWALELADVYYDPFTNLDSDNEKFDHNLDGLFMVGGGLGAWFVKENLPATKKLLVNTIHDATYYFFYFKNYYNRIRPYQLEESIKPLIKVGHPSYPSGHSSANYVNAYILSEIFPEESGRFLKVAYDMAWSRELIGVHYPSDSEVGRNFAKQFVGILLENESFLKDFEAAKKGLHQKAGL